MLELGVDEADTAAFGTDMLAEAELVGLVVWLALALALGDEVAVELALLELVAVVLLVSLELALPVAVPVLVALVLALAEALLEEVAVDVIEPLPVGDPVALEVSLGLKVMPGVICNLRRSRVLNGPGPSCLALTSLSSAVDWPHMQAKHTARRLRRTKA